MSNPCDLKTEYCVEQVGATSHTSLGPRTSTTHNMNQGDRIRVKKSGSCADLVYTVAKAGETGKVEICKKK